MAEPLKNQRLTWTVDYFNYCTEATITRGYQQEKEIDLQISILVKNMEILYEAPTCVFDRFDRVGRDMSSCSMKKEQRFLTSMSFRVHHVFIRRQGGLYTYSPQEFISLKNRVVEFPLGRHVFIFLTRKTTSYYQPDRDSHDKLRVW